MFPTLIRAARVLLMAAVCAAAPAVLAGESRSGDARQAWQMLDYIAVDYAGAVSNGQILDNGEYSEMQEFAASVRTQLPGLPASAKQAELLAAADHLASLIASKAAPTEVASQARGLAQELLATYPFAAVPAAAPNLRHGSALYADQCAGCHGAAGHGDGGAGATLDPKPVDFTDAARAAQRTPLALFEVISQGVPGTSMKAFSQLSEADRWALAFFVGGFAYSPAQRTEGEALWQSTPSLKEQLATLEALSRTSETDLASTIGAHDAAAAVAYLRATPETIAPLMPAGGPLALARQRMKESEAAFSANDRPAAVKLALSAYLDGVEPVEPLLGTRDAALLRELETAMGQYRSRVGADATRAEVDGLGRQVVALFDRAEETLQQTHTEKTTAFLGSFTILVREGLEAMLIVIGMIAFLRKAERREVLRYVHLGWVGALLAGAATWGAATFLVEISGANREVTEGISALFAAVVLLSVGLWMHQKSLAGRWQEYLHAKMSAALTRRSAFFLFSLSFIAVYREVFETILFYIAMWNEQGAGAILAGLAAGVVVLALIAYVMLRLSKRLPIGRFFSLSSILIAVLAVILVGKGVAALQEAGWLPLRLVDLPRIEWLGLYPTLQSVLAQLVVAVAAIGGFLFNTRSLSSRGGAKKE